MHVLPLMSVSQLYYGLKLLFEHNSAHKNLFLSAGFCWNSRLSWRDTEQKLNFRGTIGYGDSYLEFLFRPFKVYRLHATLHDAAGAVRSHSEKITGCCYIFGQAPVSCVLGDVTGIFFFLLWSGVACIVLATELADRNVIW